MKDRWYVADIDGGYEVACVDCWALLQTEAIDAGTKVYSTTAVVDPGCAFCGRTS